MLIQSLVSDFIFERLWLASLLLKSKKTKKPDSCVSASVVNHTVDNLAFFQHGAITPIETAAIRFYSPNISEIAMLLLLLLDIVLSLYSLCSWRRVPTESLSDSLKMHFIVHQTSRNQTQFPKWPQPVGVLSLAEKTQTWTHNALMGAFKPNTSR